MDLYGKNLVFVAGLGGIGFETCKVLMTKNLAYMFILDVIENANAIQMLEGLNPTTKVVYKKFDITDKACIRNIFEEIVEIVQYIDVLINGAGVILDRNVELAVNINLIGLINTTMEALPYMDKTQKGRGGVLMNIASVVGLEPSPAVSVYSATKFGVIGFTRSLSDPFYYKRTGVAITAICPGITESPMSKNPKISDTFDYSAPLTEKFFSAQSQPASICAQHLVQIIEMAENGAVWISNLGEKTRVEFKVHWTT